MSTPLPPIYRDIRRLLVFTEEMVRRFSRYRKYTVGTDLREQAMRLMRGVNRACFDSAQQAQLRRVGTFHVPTRLTLNNQRVGTENVPTLQIFQI